MKSPKRLLHRGINIPMHLEPIRSLQTIVGRKLVQRPDSQKQLLNAQSEGRDLEINVAMLPIPRHNDDRLTIWITRLETAKGTTVEDYLA